MFELYKTWARLGVAFNVKPTSDSVIDIEDVLIRTAHEGRDDSRLLFGMRGWLIKHHELVNSARLISKIKCLTETAVLGAIIDSVVEIHPRSNLKYIVKYCHPLSQPDFVFRSVKNSNILSQLNLQENLSLWKKWNLISREMEYNKEAIYEKKHVFKHNPWLILRALFGAGLKAEVLTYFFHHKKGNARQIAQTTQLSYEPVYSELRLLNKIGLVKEKKRGRARVFSFCPSFFKETISLFAV
ncbi:MAG: hypothetical protein ACD_62C00649G0002 [uncultured bacterium]|nr:MAG: hypothetical protein ACD_62C00649G0002 [uncultured bacterium]